MNGVSISIFYRSNCVHFAGSVGQDFVDHHCNIYCKLKTTIDADSSGFKIMVFSV